MAIAFARMSIHSRNQGHSAVAGAAYRAGEKLIDERTGEEHNFKNRKDVQYSEILLPEGADEKLSDRETLWNEVESCEKRKDAQVAKDIILALPRGLDKEQHIELAREFAKFHYVDKGLVADFAIHDHGDGNPHAHIYITTRRLHGDTFDKYKARDLNPSFANWGGGKGFISEQDYWGEQWREHQNAFFKEQGLNVEVDAHHILTQRHEGRIQEERHYLKEDNRLRRKASIHIAVNDPGSVLNLLGSKYAVFSERDIARLLHKNTDTKEQFDIALLCIKSHHDLILLGPGDDGRDHYTTRANFKREVSLSNNAEYLHNKTTHSVANKFVSRAIKRFDLNDEQSIALHYIANGGNLCAIVGRAGTGKSYMMRAARDMWEAQSYRLRGLAVSGIAAKGLEADSGISSSTIKSFTQRIHYGSLTLEANDILVMDEAGMADLNDFARIVELVKNAGAKLVVIGDPDQLQPIGPGAPFRAVVQSIGFAELTHIQRQESPGDCTASIRLSQGNIESALQHYHTQQHVHLISSTQEDDDGEGGESGGAITQLIADWGKGLSRSTIHERLILAHRNVDVDELNQTARSRMRQLRLLDDKEQQFYTKDHELMLAAGDRLLFLKNDRNLAVSNGEFATINRVNNTSITVTLDKQNGRQFTFSTADYNDFNYGYAATVHKSQGVTVNHAFVYVAGTMWDRFLAYVAMTRHRKTLNVYAEQSQFNSIKTLEKTLSRSPIKDSVLDWPLSFAMRRGFDPDSLLGRFIDKVVSFKQTLQDKWLAVTSLEAFQEEDKHTSLLSKTERLEMMKQVACFVDLRNNLAKQARMMHQDLQSGDKLFEHQDYAAWYEQTLARNQLAFVIKQNVTFYKRALALNGVSATSLNSYITAHERLLRVKEYLASSDKQTPFSKHELAKHIHRELPKHYAVIHYLSEKAAQQTQTLINTIRHDATRAHQPILSDEPSTTQQEQIITPADSVHSAKSANTQTQVTNLTNEWEQLKNIKSYAVERVCLAKTRLDKATKTQSIELQQCGYKKAVKSLCRQEKVYGKVKTIAPELAKSFEKINQSSEEITINWLSDEYGAEFDKLRQSGSKVIQSFVKHRDRLSESNNIERNKSIIQKLGSIALDIFQHKGNREIAKTLAPKLTSKLSDFSRSRSRKNNLDQEP